MDSKRRPAGLFFVLVCLRLLVDLLQVVCLCFHLLSCHSASTTQMSSAASTFLFILILIFFIFIVFIVFIFFFLVFILIFFILVFIVLIVFIFFFLVFFLIFFIWICFFFVFVRIFYFFFFFFKLDFVLFLWLVEQWVCDVNQNVRNWVPVVRDSLEKRQNFVVDVFNVIVRCVLALVERPDNLVQLLNASFLLR